MWRSVLIFLSITGFLETPVFAGEGAAHHHSGVFVALQRNDETRRLTAEGCMLGRGAEFARQWQGVFRSGPVGAEALCITALSAVLQRLELGPMVSGYTLPEGDARIGGIAFATGFHDGFLTPERYADYRAAPAEMVERLTTGCLALQGKRKDCLIAGALTAIAEREFIEANPELRDQEFGAILR